MGIERHRSGDRGYFDDEWLQAYYTFSFGHYHSSVKHFRSLRALNENNVRPGVGFPLHTHRDMEILSIVLKGGLAHQDNMGNGSILRPGGVQLMSAGRGVTYAETNASDQEDVYFLQLWIVPEQLKIEPSYQEQFFSEEEKKNRWCLIASKEGNDRSLKVHQDASIYLSTLEDHQQLTMHLAENRFGWLQVIDGEVEVNHEAAQAGDGLAIIQTPTISIRARKTTNLLFCDLN